MGDSYSSGEGIEPFFGQKDIDKKTINEDWLAHRSESAWSGMLTLPLSDGRSIKMSKYDKYNNPEGNWYFVATSGAETKHIDNSYDKDFKIKGINEKSYPLDPQINIFNELRDNGKKADYVTLTLGGNDADFSGVVTTAVVSPSYMIPNFTYHKLCDVIENRLPGIMKNLEYCYDEIYEESDHAKIIVAGYPQLVSNLGGISMTWFETNMLNTAVTQFNKAIEVVVNKCYSKNNSIYFVSVEDAFKGHEAYSDVLQVTPLAVHPEKDLDNGEFINRVVPGTLLTKDLKPSVASSYSVHPNIRGANAYAKCVQTKINELEGTTPRAKPTEKSTDKAVEIPTHKPTETNTYTAVELASKSLDEIIEIMGGDYTSEHTQLSNAFSSSGCPYIYNYDKLPGLAFAVSDSDYYGISIMDGAYLNKKITSDMNYSQIADIVGDMDGMLVGQGYNIACSTTVDGYSVAFCFIANDYIEKNYGSGTIPSSVLRDVNPSLQSIGLRREPTVKPTEKPTVAPTKASSSSEYSSYLGTWSYKRIPEEIPEEILQNEDSYQMYMERIPTVSLDFEEIDGNTATFNLQIGNIICVVGATVTSEIIDNRIDFVFDDNGWGGKGHGTIMLNGDSVYVYCVEDEHGNGNRISMDCDDTLIRND